MKQKLTNLISDHEMKLEALRLLYPKNPDKYFERLEELEIITHCLKGELKSSAIPKERRVDNYYYKNRERLAAKARENYLAKRTQKERKNKTLNALYIKDKNNEATNK